MTGQDISYYTIWAQTRNYILDNKTACMQGVKAELGFLAT